MDLQISGSENYNAFPLASEKCVVKISGSGSCYVAARDLLDVTISGSGSVFYKGHPGINSKITGSGSIIDAN